MEKVLYAADELTGLIWAAAKMRPSKSTKDMELKSLKKKFDRLEDIRQSGEATEKQLDKWTILQEKLSTIEQIIDIGW